MTTHNLLLGIFITGLVILTVLFLEAVRNWHDWYNRHPHFTLRPAGRWADTRPSAKLSSPRLPNPNLLRDPIREQYRRS